MEGMDQFVDRIREAIMGGVFAIFVTALARIWASMDATTGASAEISSAFLLTLLRSAPGIMTLSGIVIAGIIAGPPGVFGAILEIIGVDLLFNPDHTGGLGLIVIGALIVTVSSFVPWLKVYAHLFGNSRRRRY